MGGNSSQQLLYFDYVATIELEGMLINAWGKGATQERWDWWLAQLQAAIQRTPEGLVVFSALQIGEGPKNPSVRAQASREIKRLSPSIKQFVIYPGGSGVWATLARSVVRTMFMMTPGRRQFALVDGEAEAVEVLAGLGGPSRAEISQAVRLVLQAVKTDHAAA